MTTSKAKAKAVIRSIYAPTSNVAGRSLTSPTSMVSPTRSFTATSNVGTGRRLDLPTSRVEKRPTTTTKKSSSKSSSKSSGSSGSKAAPSSLAQAILGGDRAQELAASSTGSGSSSSSFSSMDSGSVDNSEWTLDKINSMLGPGYQNVSYNGPEWNPTKTPAQRAQEMMDAKYGRITAGVNSQIGTLDTELAQGQRTQDIYGQVGDAKLKEIYDQLTGKSQEVADNIQGLYGKAKDEVTQAYTDAQGVNSGVQAQAQKVLADQANQLGIQQGIPGATEDLNAFAGQQAISTAADKADSVGNIATLGANMGAAALKDVNNSATYGANNRRDLVMNVQNTKAQLQFEHDKAKKSLMDDLAAIETEKADAIASATSEQEALDFTRQADIATQKRKLAFDNQSAALAQHDSELSSILGSIKGIDEHNSSISSQKLADRSMALQERAQTAVEGQNKFDQTLALDKFQQQKVTDSDARWYQANQIRQGDRQLTNTEINDKADAAAKMGANANEAERLRQASVEQSNKENRAIADAAAKKTQDAATLEKTRAETARVTAQTKELTAKMEGGMTASNAKYGSLSEFLRSNKKDPYINNPTFKNGIQAIIGVAVSHAPMESGTKGVSPLLIAYDLVSRGNGTSSYYNDQLPAATAKQIRALLKNGVDRDKILQALSLGLPKSG